MDLTIDQAFEQCATLDGQTALPHLIFVPATLEFHDIVAYTLVDPLPSDEIPVSDTVDSIAPFNGTLAYTASHMVKPNSSSLPGIFFVPASLIGTFGGEVDISTYLGGANRPVSNLKVAIYGRTLFEPLMPNNQVTVQDSSVLSVQISMEVGGTILPVSVVKKGAVTSEIPRTSAFETTTCTLHLQAPFVTEIFPFPKLPRPKGKPGGN